MAAQWEEEQQVEGIVERRRKDRRNLLAVGCHANGT